MRMTEPGATRLPGSGPGLPPSGDGKSLAGVSGLDRVRRTPAMTRLAIVAVLCCGWETYAAFLHNPLMLPRFSDTLAAWVAATLSGELPARVWASLRLLLLGYGIALLLAAILAGMAAVSKSVGIVLTTLAGMLTPLPAIALIPLAMMWFGLSDDCLILILVHSVLWPVALNTFAGFQAVPETLRLVGRNYGLSGPRFVLSILVPASLPSILTGLRIGWAFAWRSLVAAEMVLGFATGSGGLGWFIYEAKSQLLIADVFAGLLTIIMIGLVVEGVFFNLIERRTIRRWGMQR